jgi:hypothetical protein
MGLANLREIGGVRACMMLTKMKTKSALSFVNVRSGAECIVDPRGADILCAAGRKTKSKRTRRPNDVKPPKLRKLMLVSDFQGSAVAPRTPLELRCFAV